MAGVWHCERKVSKPNITMLGKAAFEGLPDKSQYQEEGTYLWGGIEHHYFQHQTWMLNKRSLVILKHDQSVLHVFDFSHDKPLHHTHHCGDDVYEAVLDITSTNCWGLVYKVFGPKKHYQTKIIYSR